MGVEVPTADENGEYRFVANTFMDQNAGEVLSKPVDETIEVKVKKKKKKAAGGPAPDPLLELSFIGLQEGKCVLFVDLSWEDQEEKCVGAHNLRAPVARTQLHELVP